MAALAPSRAHIPARHCRGTSQFQNNSASIQKDRGYFRAIWPEQDQGLPKVDNVAGGSPMGGGNAYDKPTTGEGSIAFNTQTQQLYYFNGPLNDWYPIAAAPNALLDEWTFYRVSVPGSTEFPGTPHQTISAAIAAASAELGNIDGGGAPPAVRDRMILILVDPGVYNENITLPPGIMLRAATEDYPSQLYTIDEGFNSITAPAATGSRHVRLTGTVTLTPNAHTANHGGETHRRSVIQGFEIIQTGENPALQFDPTAADDTHFYVDLVNCLVQGESDGQAVIEFTLGGRLGESVARIHDCILQNTVDSSPLLDCDPRCAVFLDTVSFRGNVTAAPPYMLMQNCHREPNSAITVFNTGTTLEIRNSHTRYSTITPNGDSYLITNNGDLIIRDGSFTANVQQTASGATCFIMNESPDRFCLNAFATAGTQVVDISGLQVTSGGNFADIQGIRLENNPASINRIFNSTISGFIRVSGCKLETYSTRYRDFSLNINDASGAAITADAVLTTNAALPILNQVPLPLIRLQDFGSQVFMTDCYVSEGQRLAVAGQPDQVGCIEMATTSRDCALNARSCTFEGRVRMGGINTNGVGNTGAPGTRFVSLRACSCERDIHLANSIDAGSTAFDRLEVINCTVNRRGNLEFVAPFTQSHTDPFWLVNNVAGSNSSENFIISQNFIYATDDGNHWLRGVGGTAGAIPVNARSDGDNTRSPDVDVIIGAEIVLSALSQQ